MFFQKYIKKRILVFTLFFLLFSTVTVFAQSAGQQQGTANAPFVNGQQGSDSQRCADVTKKVDLVTSRYNQSQDKYMNAFQNIYQNVEKFALRFKEAGYDTTELEKHMAEYNSMIQNANRYYNEFRTGMENSKKGVCGNSDVDSGQQFNSARTQLMNSKNEMLRLRTYALETLKQDLLDLKSQVTE